MQKNYPYLWPKLDNQWINIGKCGKDIQMWYWIPSALESWTAWALSLRNWGLEIVWDWLLHHLLGSNWNPIITSSTTAPHNSTFASINQLTFEAGTGSKTQAQGAIFSHLSLYFVSDEYRVVFDSMMMAVVCQGNEMQGGPHPLLSHGSSLVIIFPVAVGFIVYCLIKLQHWVF